MGCEQYGDGVIVCRPTTFNWRSFRFCPTCERRRWFIVVEAVWYDSLMTCLGCGDTWSLGERLPRPFARGWRERSIRAARSRPYTLKAHARAALQAEIEEYVNSS